MQSLSHITSGITANSDVQIFICYSPFQVFVAELVIDELSSESITVLIKQTQIKAGAKFNAQIDMRPGFKNLIDLYSIKKFLNYAARHAGHVNIYIPHTAGVITYYAFEPLKRKYPDVSINLLYEGILFLYEYDYGYLKGSKEVQLRKLASIILRLNYKFQSNIYPAYSENINNIFTLFPKLTRGPKEKIKAIKIPSESYSPKRGRAIILGQRSSLFNEQEHRHIYHSMLDEIENNAYTEIFYKRHYSDKQNLFQKVARERGIKYKNLTTSVPVEALIKDYRPELVISMISSALINLKGIFGSSIKLQSFCPVVKSDNRKGRIIKKLYELFEKVGIANVDLQFDQ